MSGIEFSASGPAREPGARARPSPRARRRAIALGILAGVITACLMLAIDAAVSAHRMLGAISSARLHLIDGGNSVVTGDPDVATAAFRAAGLSALDALGDADRPGVRLLAGLPIVGDNVTAAKAVAQAQVDTARAGLTMADAARTMDWNTILLPTTTSLGHIDLAEVRRATPQLESVATQLQTALNRLELAGGGHLIGPVAAGYDNAVTTLGRTAALAADARDLARVAPPLFGGQGIRRYLVAVGSLAQPFGPSGRVGPVGVLTARHGTLTLEPFSPADPSIGDAATSPDAPTSAEAMLTAAEASGFDHLDGVFLMDTVGLQDLLWMVGDVDTDAWDTALSRWNAVQVLDADVLQGTNATAADVQQATIAGDVLTTGLTRHPSTEAFGTGSAEMVAGRHLVIYARDPAVQTLLSRLGATGRLVGAGNPLAIVWNTTGVARTGLLLRRPISVGVTLDASGLAKMRTVIDLEDQAPNGPPSVQLGKPFGPEPVGGYAADVERVPAQGRPAHQRGAELTDHDRDVGGGGPPRRHGSPIRVAERGDVHDRERPGAPGRHRGGRPPSVPPGDHAGADGRRRSPARVDPDPRRDGDRLDHGRHDRGRVHRAVGGRAGRAAGRADRALRLSAARATRRTGGIAQGLGQRGVRAVPVREHGLGERPGDREVGVVPGDAVLVLAREVGVHLIEEGDVGARAEPVRHPRRDVEAAQPLVGVEVDRAHLAERGRAVPEIDQGDERPALEHAPVVRLLEVVVQAAQHPGPAATQVGLEDRRRPLGQPLLPVELDEGAAPVGVRERDP